MELPPYRVPTLKGLCIHTWERTWQYIKKAGTIILGISIILWCMMTFPRPSEDEIAFYENQRHQMRAALVSSGVGPASVRDPATLKALDELYGRYREALIGNDPEALEDMKGNRLFPEIQKLASGDQALRAPADGDEQTRAWVAAYHMYRKRLTGVTLQEQGAALRGTVAGGIGSALEVFTTALGFDYRVNVALLGGFAAKEVIISTLGTAYSLGETDPEGSGALSNRLRKDPGWSPLLAFTLIIFIMLYVPCFATVVAMKKESSWRWAGFSVFFNLTVAFLVSLIVYQGGKALGLG
jgi:ferrous iron transport protein B